jgi:signal transduction histidine kinase
LILFYEDNGVGIPLNEKKKIFAKGYGKGTGLGLFLIEKMCKTYGWKIIETGTFGKGVQFRFEVPKGKFLLDQNGAKNN